MRKLRDVLVVADDNLALLGQIGSVVKVNGVLREHRVIAKFRRINYMAQSLSLQYGDCLLYTSPSPRDA